MRILVFLYLFLGCALGQCTIYETYSTQSGLKPSTVADFVNLSRPLLPENLHLAQQVSVPKPYRAIGCIHYITFFLDKIESEGSLTFHIDDLPPNRGVAVLMRGINNSTWYFANSPVTLGDRSAKIGLTSVLSGKPSFGHAYLFLPVSIPKAPQFFGPRLGEVGELKPNSSFRSSTGLEITAPTGLEYPMPVLIQRLNPIFLNDFPLDEDRELAGKIYRIVGLEGFTIQTCFTLYVPFDKRLLEKQIYLAYFLSSEDGVSDPVYVGPEFFYWHIMYNSVLETHTNIVSERLCWHPDKGLIVAPILIDRNAIARR